MDLLGDICCTQPLQAKQRELQIEEPASQGWLPEQPAIYLPRYFHLPLLSGGLCGLKCPHNHTERGEENLDFTLCNTNPGRDPQTHPSSSAAKESHQIYAEVLWSLTASAPTTVVFSVQGCHGIHIRLNCLAACTVNGEKQPKPT